MVEVVSWIMVALVAVFAMVGFLGVLGTGLALGLRHLAAMRSSEQSHVKTALRAG